MHEGVGNVDGAVATVGGAVVDEPQGVGAVEDNVFPGDDAGAGDADGWAETGAPDDAVVAVAEAGPETQGGGPGDEGCVGGEEEGEGARGGDAEAVGVPEGENDENGSREGKGGKDGEKAAGEGIAELGHGRGRWHTSRSMAGGVEDVKRRIGAVAQKRTTKRGQVHSC